MNTATNELNNELKAIMDNFNKTKEANSVESYFPVLKKTFSYRKHIVVRSLA